MLIRIIYLEWDLYSPVFLMTLATTNIRAMTIQSGPVIHGAWQGAGGNAKHDVDEETKEREIHNPIP